MACGSVFGPFHTITTDAFLERKFFIDRMGFGPFFVTKGFSSKERNTYA